MLEELRQCPELGLLGGEMWSGRATTLVQCGRSAEQLFACAKGRDAGPFRPGGTSIAVGTSGDVDVSRETYLTRPRNVREHPRQHEPIGLGMVDSLSKVAGSLRSVEARLRGGN